MHERSFRWCVTIILIGLFKLSLLKKVILSLIYECVPIDKKNIYVGSVDLCYFKNVHLQKKTERFKYMSKVSESSRLFMILDW